MSGIINTASLISSAREILAEEKERLWWVNHDLLTGAIDRLEEYAARRGARAALAWTDDPPTVPGWYWVGKLGRCWVVQFKHYDLGNGLYPSDEGYMYAGPMPEPV